MVRTQFFTHRNLFFVSSKWVVSKRNKPILTIVKYLTFIPGAQKFTDHNAHYKHSIKISKQAHEDRCFFCYYR